jgi:RibD domain-containing protein
LAVQRCRVTSIRFRDSDVDLCCALQLLGKAGHCGVFAEGGPRLNAQLAAADLIDELCLTIAPCLIGGDSRRGVQHFSLIPDDPLAGLVIDKVYVGYFCWGRPSSYQLCWTWPTCSAGSSLTSPDDCRHPPGVEGHGAVTAGARTRPPPRVVAGAES